MSGLAARIPIWREVTVRRAEGEDERARGFEKDAEQAQPDDARILRGKAAIARIHAAAERKAVELYDQLARGHEVAPAAARGDQLGLAGVA